jgi:phage-related minor tail protein
MHARPTGYLVGGSFIAKIASSLKVKKKIFQKLDALKFLDMMTCQRMEMVTLVQPYQFIDQWNRIWAPYRAVPDPDLVELMQE